MTHLQAALQSWQDFYWLMGGASATLIGLTFVTVSVGVRTITPETIWRVHVSLTPVVVRFAAVLLVSSIILIPSHSRISLTSALILVGIAGGGHLFYVMSGMHRIDRESGRRLSSAWRWNIAMPIVAYIGILVAAVQVSKYIDAGLTTLAASTLLLLFVTIHNAWQSTVEIASRQTD